MLSEYSMPGLTTHFSPLFQTGRAADLAHGGLERVDHDRDHPGREPGLGLQPDLRGERHDRELSLVLFACRWRSVQLPGGGVNFSFGAALAVDASKPLSVGSFTINVSAGAAPGTRITLTGASTVTDSAFNDIFVGPITIAQVVPEPATASLLALALALGGLALLGRKRSA